MLAVKLKAVTGVVLIGLVGAGAGGLYSQPEAVAQPSGPGGGRAPAQPGQAFDPTAMEQALPRLLKEKPIKVEEKDDELQKLLKERYNQAHDETALRYQGFWVGRQTLQGMHEAGMRLVKAGLELTKKPKDQVDLLRGYVDVTKEIEKIVDKRFREGRVGMADLRQARYYRLDAEIQLLRLKRKMK